jgi:hypothetical protein
MNNDYDDDEGNDVWVPCSMCGANEDGHGVACLDARICFACLDKHPDKTTDELLRPFLRQYHGADGKLKTHLRRPQ